ncbi:hypothetical protein [Alishewanella jeotgali]|uniref:Uncharacterized protein n=1 Tax=Alishewanella jeotgali KCTC 22429 TaxID=1129374 RepID=H3ZIK1_9ALTE|nr:hypothetical protein [Alishewanella jeotgali]EHR39651.1 hypothetical protein AJE_16059 [Alishewanella jeotgali KCTC 22429]
MRRILVFLLAVLLAASAGSMIQSLVNLQAIAALAGPVATADQLSTLWFDLRHFMPVLAAIFLPIMLLSLIAARLLLNRTPLIKAPTVFAITVLATWLALSVINQLAPMPTLIALNRTLAGTLMLLACSGLGAVFYHYFSRSRSVS